MKCSSAATLAFLAAAMLFGNASLGADEKASASQQLELFGMPLKGAERDQFRKVLKRNGMQPTREDKAYWVDTYNCKGILEGATQYKAGFVSATGRYAYSEYVFPGFMDTELVGQVIKMVSIKYGHPSSQQGRYGLGPVTAKWNLQNGMQIEVSRDWPDTTTYLKYIDTTAYNQMRTEMDAARNTREREKAKSQSKAF